MLLFVFRTLEHQTILWSAPPSCGYRLFEASSGVLCTPDSLFSKQVLFELTIHFLNQVALGSIRARKCSGVINCSSDDPNSGSELVENRLKVLARTVSRNLKEVTVRS